MANTEKKWLTAQQLGPRMRVFNYIAVSVALIAVVSVFVWRLYVLQIKDTDAYTTLAREQQLKDETITAERGSIYDATGKVLASSSIVWDISCAPISSSGLYITVEEGEGEDAIVKYILLESVCAEISDGVARILLANDGSDGSDIDSTSQEYLTQYNYIYERFSQTESYYRSLAKKVDLPVAEALEAFIANYNEVNETGIVLSTVQTTKRTYPYGAFAASILGFCNSDGAGMYGLEKSYDSVLAGTDGRSMTVQNVYGSDIADNTGITYAAQDGYNLMLSIDVNVQQIAEYYLEEAIAANDVENRGTCIVMNVNTGEIVAMATKVDYDPNDPYAYYDEDYLSAMIYDEPEIYAQYLYDENGNVVLDAYGYEVVDADADYSGTYREIQWRNKAITELYYPGSIFKLFTAAAAIDSGLANENTCYTCSGSYTVGDTTYSCAGGVVHGTQTMADAIRNSCNIYFIMLAEDMGADTFYDYYKAFGFTETTGVDLPYETNYMQYYDADGLGAVQLASSSFGQAQVVTALQVCTATAACVNGGYLITPTVVSSIVDDNGNLVEETETTVKRQVISEDVSDTMQYLMEYEVGYGTVEKGGFRSYVAGYRIGGKSGTSEQLNLDKRISDGDYKMISSYIAVLPADDPEYLVYMMLDDPNNESSDYASILVAPMVGNIISEISPYLGIETTGEDLSEESITVPNIVGKTWSLGQVELNRVGLDHQLIESDTVDTTAAVITYQYPAAGTTVTGGTTIYYYIEGTEGIMTSVPDVVGKTASFAQQLLTAAGLNCTIIGDEDYLVTSQSITADESVELGTIITIVCESDY
ncbi:MAG: penicillin-binding transpeptidase domain-containing protein [Faecalibacterium sp.]